MERVPRLTLIILLALFAVTLVVGFVGWWKVYGEGAEPSISDALYHTLLAFTGDDTFIEKPDGQKLNGWIEIARFTGLLTTISAIFGVAVLFLREQIKRILASWRSEHLVIIGASDFVLDVFKSEIVTIFESDDLVTDRRRLPRRALFLPGKITKTTGTYRSLGKPKAIVFGSKETVLNVERAQTWLSEMAENTERVPDLILRIEDGSVARDLELLSSSFRSAQLVSRSETIARALLTSMVPTELAIRRGQNRPHLALVGLGSTNLAVAEEAALRCQNFNLEPLRLTIVDMNIERAKQRIRQERPDLLGFSDDSVQVEFVTLDALECCASGQADHLLSVETDQPLTAIVVATGCDTRNTAIAMRLRQLQLEQLRLRAPIYMRSDSLATVSAALPTDLTGGIIPFGGSILDIEDLELEQLYHQLAEAIHNRWRNIPMVEKTPENDWQHMSTADRRASYRAALSAVEMFYAAGFLPPPGERLSGLRLEPSAANSALGDDELIRRMSKMEHDRWIIERTLEGYRGTESYRDNEKKYHPLMRPFLLLPDGEGDKDEKNVKETLTLGIDLHEEAIGAPCWRQVLRIGLVGPLDVGEALSHAEVAKCLDTLFAKHSSAVASELEILTPNAPGFDRFGAISLAREWKKRTNRPARVILMNAARVPMMDKIAGETVCNEVEETFATQTRALTALSKTGHHVVSMDCRPLGVSDADLDANRDQYFEIVKKVQTEIMDLAHYMFFFQRSGAKWTASAMEQWSKLGKV
ncbi:MAG: hypothetical protein AAF636_23670 [Pseudomonadota bacterium]